MKIIDITNRVDEDAQSDAKYYGMADTFVREISQYFYADGKYRGFKDLIEFHLRDGIYYMMDQSDLPILGKHPDIRIAFGLQKPDEKGGMMRMPSPEKYGFKYVVLVYCLNPNLMHDEEGQKQIAGKITSNSTIHDTIRHELIHVFDARRMTTKVTKHYQQDSFPSTNKERKSYFNDEMEFNAYFHNFTDRLMSVTKAMQEHPHDAVDYAELYDFNPDFNTMLGEYIKGRTSNLKQFLSSLNAKRRKRLLSRIYKLHQYAVSLLRQG